jgi:hypothetical protein
MLMATERTAATEHLTTWAQSRITTWACIAALPP